eukprot:865195-Alexandrium_andersonii.AAC.1
MVQNAPKGCLKLPSAVWGGVARFWAELCTLGQNWAPSGCARMRITPPKSAEIRLQTLNST